MGNVSSRAADSLDFLSKPLSEAMTCCDKQDHIESSQPAKPSNDNNGFVNLKAARRMSAGEQHRAFRLEKKDLAELPFHRVKDVECYPLTDAAGKPLVSWNSRSRLSERGDSAHTPRPLSPTSELINQLDSIVHRSSQSSSPQPVMGRRGGSVMYEPPEPELQAAAGVRVQIRTAEAQERMDPELLFMTEM
mmetsp:Transcript_8816/g.20056  ORF Transcript_8816/g.20056 Transcript_8816/m.20056 type:complete len:191 (-) Transcript_8816:52-624(-)